MSDGSPILFLDFDGTISRADVVDALLERFALPEWRQLDTPPRRCVSQCSLHRHASHPEPDRR